MTTAQSGMVCRKNIRATSGSEFDHKTDPYPRVVSGLRALMYNAHSTAELKLITEDVLEIHV